MPLSSKFSATANDLRRNSDLSPLRHRPTAHRLSAVASDRHAQPPKCPCSQLVRPLRLSFGPRSVFHHSTQALRRFSSYARPPKPLCVRSNCTALPCPACEPPDQRRFRSSHTRAFKTPQPLVPVAPHSDLSLFHDLSSAESLQMLRAVLQTAVRSVMNSSASRNHTQSSRRSRIRPAVPSASRFRLQSVFIGIQHTNRLTILVSKAASGHSDALCPAHLPVAPSFSDLGLFLIRPRRDITA